MPQHADQMPRERLQSIGASRMDTAELLAILIGSGVHGHPVGEVAVDLLRKFGGSLVDMSDSTPEEICKRVQGLGMAKATTILAALEIGYRRHRQEVQGMTICTAHDAYRCMVGDIGGLSHEELWIAVLDSGLHVRYKECASTTGTHSTAVDINSLLRTTLKHGCERFVLAHNHPSGNIAPSDDDVTLTMQTRDRAKLIGLEMTDHIIIGQGQTEFFSFKEGIVNI